MTTFLICHWLVRCHSPDNHFSDLSAADFRSHFSMKSCDFDGTITFVQGSRLFNAKILYLP